MSKIICFGDYKILKLVSYLKFDTESPFATVWCPFSRASRVLLLWLLASSTVPSPGAAEKARDESPPICDNMLPHEACAGTMMGMAVPTIRRKPARATSRATQTCLKKLHLLYGTPPSRCPRWVQVNPKTEHGFTETQPKDNRGVKKNGTIE